MFRPHDISESPDVNDPAAVDPLTEVVTLLRPGAPFAKVVGAAGRWRVRREDAGRPSYRVVLEGSCLLTLDGEAPITLHTGDFVLIPATYHHTTTSLEPPPPHVATAWPAIQPDGTFKIGEGPATVRMLIGYCDFGSPDAALLVSLLPRLVLVRGEARLAALVQLVGDEASARRPARDLVVERLLEVMLIEALRATDGSAPTAGLVRGLADERLAIALRLMHQTPSHAWSVAELAKRTALSRSVFFERFKRAVGVTPMDYLLNWRMALAKTLLRRDALSVAQVAERVGYRSAATFSMAFTRHAGLSPGRYARAPEAIAQPDADLAATPSLGAAPPHQPNSLRFQTKPVSSRPESA